MKPFATLAAATALAVGLHGRPAAQAAKGTEVRVVGSTSSLLLAPSAPEQVSHNRRILFLGFSRDVYRFKGARATVRLSERSPLLEFTGPDPVDADDIWVLRLHLNDGSREVGHTSSLEHPYDTSDIVGTTVTAAADATPHVLRLRPSALEPGEYAIVVGRLFFDFGVD